MPLYEYKCDDCGFRFEELKHSSDVDVVECNRCHGSARRQVSTFSHSVVGGSSNESVDMTIGREANKRWQMHYDRQSKRRGDKELQSFNLPKGTDGKYRPVMALGGKKETENRKEYVGALQEHRKKRQEKGQPQFSGPGAF